MSTLYPSGTLYVIASPIGHIGDLTERARQILSELKCIFCEDRRQTLELFKRANITKQTSLKLICLNEHEEINSISYLEKYISQFDSIGYLSDAGTPAISDPGSLLVSTARKMGLKVIPVPGVSALTTFLSIAGAPVGPITFIGFLPKKANMKKTFFKDFHGEDRFLVFFESPKRIRETLEILKEVNISLPLYLGRELTKTYEEFILIDREKLHEPQMPWLIEKGEFVLGFFQKKQENTSWMNAALELNIKLSLKETSAFISQYFNINKNKVYNYLLEYQKKESN